MDTKNLDIVYCLKNGNDSYEELRYSLRSLINFPHRNVWIYGGCPDWVKNIHHVRMTQGLNKWQNSTNMLEEACRNEQLSKNIVWFNDDFFIMNPVYELNYWHDRTLNDRIEDFRTPTQETSNYGRMLRSVEQALLEQDKPTKNFALHIPIIYNRKKFLQMCQKYPNCIHGRSLYANEYGVKSRQHDDVKIYNTEDKIPARAQFASTSDSTFKYGEVGRQIRNRFSEPYLYESTISSNFVYSPGFRK